MAIAQVQPIPVEKGWPLLGVLPNLLRDDPFEYLKNVMLEKGDFVRLNIGPQPVYLVSHPDYLKRILWENYHNYRKPDMLYKNARRSVGNGLVTSSGEFWLRQRRMIQPHLHRKQLVSLFGDMVEAISDVLKSWEGFAAKGEEIELGDRMGEISSTVTTYAIFGKGIFPPAEIANLSQRIMTLFKRGGEVLYSSLLPGWWPPTPAQQRHELNRVVIKERVGQLIVRCREEKASSASLIRALLNTVDEESNEHMTEQQLFDEVMTLIVAGYETTATALTWLGVVIHKHPDVLEKLRAEIDDVLGEHHPSFDDISRLNYTRQVFMEILRMYTIVPFLPRALNEADQLGTYSLPANAVVLVFYHGVHHNPYVWAEPEVFDPERFAPQNIANQHAFAYVPFSAGPRKCAGNDFALLEGILAIAMVLQKYNIHLIPDQVFPARIGSTMYPRNGVKVIYSLRASVKDQIELVE